MRKQSGQFGKLLRSLRQQSGIGIKRLAPELGVTYSYVSKLENGATGPSEDVVYRAARYFSCDPNALLLAAGKVPKEIMAILQEHPEEAATILRQRFGARHGRRRP